MLEQTALMRAVSRHRLEAARLLLGRGSAADNTDRLGRSALFLASSHGADDAMLRLLLDAGARVAVSDADGWTALHVASFHGHADAVKTLLG